MDFIATKLICLSKPYRSHFHPKSLKYSTFPGLDFGNLTSATIFKHPVECDNNVYTVAMKQCVHLTIMQLAMYDSSMYVSRVLDSQLLNGSCHRYENCRLCSRPHSHDSVIFFVFLEFIFFKLRRV